MGLKDSKNDQFLTFYPFIVYQRVGVITTNNESDYQIYTDDNEL